MSFLKANWFKIGVLVCLLLVAFTVYQSFVVLPEKEANRKENADFLEQVRLENQEQEKQDNLDACLADAQRVYDTNWLSSCRTQGKLSSYCLNITDPDGGYEAYLKVAATTTSIENLSNYSAAKVECSCTLPNVTATRWDDTLRSDEDRCYERFN